METIKSSLSEDKRKEVGKALVMMVIKEVEKELGPIDKASNYDLLFFGAVFADLIAVFGGYAGDEDIYIQTMISFFEQIRREKILENRSRYALHIPEKGNMLKQFLSEYGIEIGGATKDLVGGRQ